jgi:hypothetical protein
MFAHSLSSNHEIDYTDTIEYTCSADCSREILRLHIRPNQMKNDVDFTGGKMTDGQMYQPSLCYANSKVEQKSEEDCQGQAHYSPRDQIMFDKPKDVRLIDINMPETNLSVRFNS